MRANEVCKRSIATVGKDATVVRAAAIMRQHHLHDLVVVERKGGRWAPTGIITEHDIVIEVVGQGLDPSQVTVAAAMNRGDGRKSAGAMDSMAMDELLALLVTELNGIGQPIRQHRLTLPG